MPTKRADTFFVRLFLLCLIVIIASGGLQALGRVYSLPLDTVADASYAVAFIAVLPLYQRKKKRLSLLSYLVFALVCVCAVSCLLTGGDRIVLLKFAIALFLSFSAAMTLERDEVQLLIRMLCVVGAFYSLLIIAMHGRIEQAVKARVTSYLPITLLPGLTLALALCRMLCGGREKLWLLIIEVAVSLIAVISYQGRGNFLFALLVAILIALLANSWQSSRFVKVLLSLAVVLGLVLFIYLLFASDELTSRFDRLFNNTSREPRIAVWKAYIEQMNEQGAWIWGIGFSNSSQFDLPYRAAYPHDYFLEMAGELGIVGAVLAIVLTIVVLRMVAGVHRGILRRGLQDDPEAARSYACCGGLLFLLGLHLKSYSIWAGFPLFIFIGLLASCWHDLVDSRESTR